MGEPQDSRRRGCTWRCRAVPLELRATLVQHAMRGRMNIVLWVLQVLLAVAFLAHGCLLLFPPAAIVDQMNASLPRWFQLFLGVAEILARGGLPLPGFP